MTSFKRVYLKKKCTGKTGENKSPNKRITSSSFNNFVNPINNNKKGKLLKWILGFVKKKCDIDN